MTQEATQITETPPLPGLQLVQDINKAIRTIATDFAGDVDPASLAWPFCTWAHPAEGTVKRRNAANTQWVVEGRLFRAHLPMYAQADVPETDIGPIYIIGKGPAELLGSSYLAQDAEALQWLGTPIGGYITSYSPPPTDDPRFRYILCTAGETGTGGYNEGVLDSETVSGTYPDVEATAVVALAASPMFGVTIGLINTEESILRPRDGHDRELQPAEVGRHDHPGSVPQTVLWRGTQASAIFGGTPEKSETYRTGFSAGTENRMKNRGATYYMRAL